MYINCLFTLYIIFTTTTAATTATAAINSIGKHEMVVSQLYQIMINVLSRSIPDRESRLVLFNAIQNDFKLLQSFNSEQRSLLYDLNRVCFVVFQ